MLIIACCAFTLSESRSINTGKRKMIRPAGTPHPPLLVLSPRCSIATCFLNSAQKSLPVAIVPADMVSKLSCNILMVEHTFVTTLLL